ncbi:MAG: hypothetical protein R3C56_24150 [Pirellulaceae bacterium]
MLLNDNLLNLKRVKIPRAGWLAACLMLTCAFTTQGVGQDYVGVLPEMLKPEVSQKLGLSEEQRESIQQLIRAHECGHWSRSSFARGTG